MHSSCTVACIGTSHDVSSSTFGTSTDKRIIKFRSRMNKDRFCKTMASVTYVDT